MEKGDQAFRTENKNERWVEMTYGGALSFLRRKYTREITKGDVVVSGVPFDNAVTYRPGCRLGPRAIRAASVQLAELKAFPYGFDPFESVNVIDYGDVFLNPHEPLLVPQSIEAHAAEILKAGGHMLTLGGDHFVSYPLLKAHAKQHGALALIQIDAHCDTWPDQPGTMDHGTMFGRAAAEGVIDPAKSTQIGLRTQNDSAHGFEILTAPFVHKEGIEKTLQIALERAGDHPVYISFDIDALDPAFAPGTGTPVPGGLASWQALELMRGFAPLNLVGMDLVEVSPPFDHAEITAIAAAHIAHEYICLLAVQKNARENRIGR